MRKVAIALIASIAAATAAEPVDFLHMPRHTVEIQASQLGGRPDNARLKGYYLYREGDRFVMLSHRPDGHYNEFNAAAMLDRGRFDRIDVIEQGKNDQVGGRGTRLTWDLLTRWQRANGITFRVFNARYLVFDLRQDRGDGPLPAIFVGRNEDRYQSGSGYVLIDLMK